MVTQPSVSQVVPAAPDARGFERIHSLWDELAAFKAARAEPALMHLLDAVGEMVEAQNAYWICVERLTDDESDPFRGWRPRSIRYLRPLARIGLPSREGVGSNRREKIDELAVTRVRLAGNFRACRLRDLVSPDWFRGERYQGFLRQGVHDLLVVGVPIDPMVEVYYGFLRMNADEPFTEAQQQLAFYALRGLTWFHSQVLLAHGPVAAGSPLSPQERRVLALLLAGQAEKQIAAELAITPSTLHTYVRDVLRKFGVSGRSDLSSLWLGRRH